MYSLRTSERWRVSAFLCAKRSDCALAFAWVLVRWSGWRFDGAPGGLAVWIARHLRGGSWRRQRLALRRRRRNFRLSPIDEVGRGRLLLLRLGCLRAGELDRNQPHAPAHRQRDRHGEHAGDQPRPRKAVRGRQTDRPVDGLEMLPDCHLCSRGGTSTMVVRFRPEAGSPASAAITVAISAVQLQVASR